jgi:hypothetical protein
LWYWKKKLDTKAVSARLAPRCKSMFSEVVVVSREGATTPRIEVVTRSGAAIRLEGSFDATLLREVLRVVESC